MGIQLREKTLNKDIDIREFTDCQLTAFFDFRGYSITPIRQNQRVAFIVRGYGIDDVIDEFYKNPKIPILDFCNSYKKIRSMIFNLRGSK